MKTIIVENLSKCYRKGGYNPYQSLRDAFSGILRKRREEGIIWALKDVSFEVEEGEVLGIIGPNGAGKTTLLKILSRITEPTSGRAIVRGRVGSLLEVGVGFHPELTGRENIYLNGAILGMKKSEIDRKFDEIVEFAELSEFIDTPIKYYSSGMRLRLAFSVAAFLDTDIVLVDEVLAVGDIAFQEKSKLKMTEIASQGRSVLFVSHNLRAIETLTSRCVYLSEGKVRKIGKTIEVIKYYKEDMHKENLSVLPEVKIQSVSPVVICENFKIITERGNGTNILEVGENVKLKFDVISRKRLENAVICVRFYRDGVVVSGNNSWNNIGKISLEKNERKTVEIDFDLNLLPGEYDIVVFILPSYFSALEEALSKFYTMRVTVHGTCKFGGGFVYLPQKWSIKP